MAFRDIADLFLDGVDILRTTVSQASKAVLAQIGSVTGETTDADNVVWVQQVGFLSRPPEPEAGKQAAQGWGIRIGGRLLIFASRDLRGLELAGTLAPGETCIYGPGTDGKGQARALFKKDGSIALYTTKGNAPGGTGMMIQIDATAGAIRMTNDKGYGLIIDGDGVALTSKSAALKLEGGGNVSIVGTGQTQVDGGSVVIGSMVVPVVNAAITGPTGVAGKASLKVLIE